uniref:protein-glutamine gamma-glutamyltransferase n=1 Tax=Sinocyclocheilus rhinocerous TaxID=307959 RepID=A0A673NBC6_9TELE
NNHTHRTEEMDVERLVVRRGQPFSVVLQCTEHIPQLQDLQLNLILHLDSQHHGKWWFNQRNAQGEVMLTLHSPTDALVGLYSMTVVLLSADGQILEQTKPQTFYLLFNPWCKDDSVYLPSEELLQEYILNENGILYQGSWDDITTVPWNFGQFEKDVVDICFEVLDNSPTALKNSEMEIANRGSPVYVSRTITAMVNANDDRGVVSGRWDGKYSDGVAPTRWTGSVPILRRWSEDGGQKVRYGQCWVFTGVACTVLRCLGIPTRCITNYSSAHDTDANISVDYLFNDQLEISPSIFRNYHCWVESWMKRDDLPEGYDGWQVLDPTPQERSDGIFCCGPCPVRAVKEGEVGLKYDTPFVFSEVNADLIVWIVHPDGERIQVSQNSKVIGRNISTKSVYGDFREDITANYKYPEGKNKRPYPELFSAQWHLQTNFTSPLRTIHSKISLHHFIAHKEVLRLQYGHYGACVSEHHMIRVTALLQPTDQDNIILQEINIPLKMPALHIKVMNCSINTSTVSMALALLPMTDICSKFQIIGKAIVSRKLTAHISFNNPLPVSLQGGMFTVEGAGLTEAKEIKTQYVLVLEIMQSMYST